MRFEERNKEMFEYYWIGWKEKNSNYYSKKNVECVEIV